MLKFGMMIEFFCWYSSTMVEILLIMVVVVLVVVGDIRVRFDHGVI